MNYTKTKIKSASIPLVDPPNGFNFRKARDFQSESIEWYISDTSEPILLLQSPTGSGKTAAFTHMAQKSNKSLFIYPTNSLIEQQKEILDDIDGIRPIIINSSNITSSGNQRTKNLRNIIERPANNVFLTNPDILEAIIQGQYLDPSDSLIREVFEYMDLVVYDEFHYYDEFESSGLLLQTKILSERMNKKNSNPNIVFSSATPSEDYLEFAENELKLDIKRVKTNIKNEGSEKFRQTTKLNIIPEDISNNHRQILDRLKSKIEKEEDLKNPSVAVIFNSAKESNRFNKIAKNEYKDVYSRIKIDNGYNTYEQKESSDNYYILNTTSKGEVGLDFDIEYLYMQVPFTASSFIQRFGRAGRHSEAEVYVYGLESKEYPETIKYEDFISSIYNKLPTPQMNKNRIRNLIGMRSAVAIQNRENKQNKYDNKEVYKDLATVSCYNKWKNFLKSTKPIDDPWKNPDSTSKKTLDHIEECSTVLSSLRGSSNSVSIEFPIGDTVRKTEYSAITALAHYHIKNIDYDKNKIVLGQEREESDIKIQYKNYGDIKEDFYKFRWHDFPIDDVKSKIYRSNFNNTVDVNIDEVLSFYKYLNKRAKIAGRIYLPEYEDYIDLSRLS